MNNLIPLEFNNQRIITTKVLAEEFGTEEKNIQMNFSRNEERFVEGKHYYKLEGQQLKFFKDSLPTESREPIKFAPVLYLWTERGAARHAKILDTDEAWDVYEELEETYFRSKNRQATKQLSAREKLELHYQFSEENAKRIDNLEQELVDTKNDFKEFQEDLPLIGAEPEELQAVVQSAGTRALGGYECPAYKDKKLRARVFQSVWKYVKDQFNVRKYKAIKRKHLSKAKEIAENYTAPFYLQEEIDMINNQSQLNI